MPYEKLTRGQKAEFGTFCRQRFGLDDSAECYAIFVERQRKSEEIYRRNVQKNSEEMDRRKEESGTPAR
jgi:hypothetical protein